MKNINKGCFRCYFHIGKLGFKVPRFNSYNGNPFLGFLCGIIMNILERKRYRYYVLRKPIKQWGKMWKYSGDIPCLCPCYLSIFGLLNVCEHLPKALDWEELSRYGECVLDIDEDYLNRSTAYLLVNDIKPENFRTNEVGNLYCVDYGDFKIGNMRRTGILNIDYK